MVLIGAHRAARVDCVRIVAVGGIAAGRSSEVEQDGGNSGIAVSGAGGRCRRRADDNVRQSLYSDSQPGRGARSGHPSCLRQQSYRREIPDRSNARILVERFCASRTAKYICLQKKDEATRL